MFLVNSRLSLSFAACSPLSPKREKLPRHPLFRRYGVILPSSLTEGRSITLGCFSLPTCVGLRYGRKRISLEAFLGGLGTSDFRTLAGTRCRRHVLVTGICLDYTLRRHAQPVHSLGSLSLPRPLFTDNDPLPVQDSHTCLPSPTTIMSSAWDPTHPETIDVAQEPSGFRCVWFSQTLRYSFRHSHFWLLHQSFRSGFSA